MTKRHLLLCIDAFGTLFSPKRPIAQQYGEVARSLGIGGFTDDQLQESFKKAFKHESKENPNYGKANGMNAEKWWANIIHNTFQPFIGADNKIHSDLAPRLIYRFSSEEGYNLNPGVRSLLSVLRRKPLPGFDRVVVGVITNSDDRVPSVLTSLGLRVSPLRYGTGGNITKPLGDEQYDIDFSVMSYDVGHEKPDRRIFAAAEEMLQSLPAADSVGPSEWRKVYVGDDYDKDIVGARNAGFSAIMVAQTTPPKAAFDARPEALESMPDEGCAFRVDDLGELARWLGADGIDTND